MKEATGELNMTVITVVAIAAVAGLFYAFVWPMIQRNIVDNTCKSFGDYEVSTTAGNDCLTTDGTNVASTSSEINSGTTYYCCPKNN